MSAGLVVSDLSVAYRGAVRALDSVSLKVPGGERVAVLGPNGAGKTTLVRSLTGMLAFYGGRVVAGSITAGDVDISSARTATTVRLGMTQVPEGRQVFKNLTVEENLRLGALTRRKHEIAADIEAAIGHFPALESKRKTRAGLLSGGEQQMLAIARGLMSKPKVLVIDELTLGLSPRVIEDLTEHLEEILSSTGASLLLVEQNARLALRLCRYAYILDRGRLTMQGTSEELTEDRRIQEAYLGVRREATEASL
jgi:ABC-type branched-subunit amino acid transport system ATPase component